VAKFGVQEWADGTALYYILSDPLFGVSDWLRPGMLEMLQHGPVVAVFTWGTILLELALFLGLFLPTAVAKRLLAVGILFHALIAAVMGLVTFGLSASAALILYLQPAQDELRFSYLSRLLRSTTHLRTRGTGGAEARESNIYTI
jgi:antimicrobial peptide system SdpB family protein